MASVLHRQTREISLLDLEAVLKGHREVISTCAAPVLLSLGRHTPIQRKDVRSGTVPRM
jgi:hypothetical protein